jgi:hypothetical protein
MKKKIVFALLMGMITTGIISFTLISFNSGYGDKFIKVWLPFWLIAYSVAVPVILLIDPHVQRMVDYIFASD